MLDSTSRITASPSISQEPDAVRRGLRPKNSSLTPKTYSSDFMFARRVELFFDGFCNVANLGQR